MKIIEHEKARGLKLVKTRG